MANGVLYHAKPCGNQTLVLLLHVHDEVVAKPKLYAYPCLKDEA